MERELLYINLLERKQHLTAVTDELKRRFIGLDSVIDEVVNLLSAWYLFPQAQLRPTIINLWGMTGSGKSALVQAIVELLDYKRHYAHLDMGEFESDSASWLKSTFTDEMSYFHEKACIICLDEFQFARTIDNKENELGKDKLRVIWDLLDTGKLSYISEGGKYYIRRAEKCVANLLRAQANMVKLVNGMVVEEIDQFKEIFSGFYFEDDDREDSPIDHAYLLSKDFINGIYYLSIDPDLTREKIGLILKQSNLDDILNLILEAAKTRMGVKQLDLSKSIVFVLGNLDEAYHMSHSLNPDINADDLHEATSKITVANIKSALKKRFRNEQIARLGNNHIIYRSFKSEHFLELIKRELLRITHFIHQEFGYTIAFHPSLIEVIYQEGVYPAQGTRPVYTTIKNLVESWIGRITVLYIEKNIKNGFIEWSCEHDNYIFVLKDEHNLIKYTYKEKVDLKMSKLRRTTNKDVQAHTAVHEAGHAILAALTLRIIPSLVVSKTAGDQCEGFCLVNFPQAILTREILKKDIIISLGGFLAEKIVFGEEHTSSGVYADIENATEQANKAIKYYAMGSNPIYIAVESANSNEHFFGTQAHTQEAMLLIENAKIEAEVLLQRNKLLLLKMAQYLTHNNRMEEALIAEYIIKYSAEDWVKEEAFIKKEDYYLFNQTIENQIAAIENEVCYVEC